MKKWYKFLWIIPLVAIDQVSKYIAQYFLKDGKVIEVIRNVFEFNYLENRGAAFGILQNKLIFFVLSTIIVLTIIIWFYNKIPDDKHYNPIKIVIIFITAGAIGNCIDRIVNNFVIDFLYFKLINFPVFNIADIYVSVSTVILIILFIFYYKEKDFAFIEKKSKSEKTEVKND